MVRIRNQANSSTLFQFNDTTKVLLNKPSLIETVSFETAEQSRYGYKSIIKRQTGVKNIRLAFQVVLIGSARETDLTSLRNALKDNEFVYLDTETHQTHLNGVYAPTGVFRQKKDEADEIINVWFNLIEKES